MLLYRAGKLASDFQQLLLELFFDASQLVHILSTQDKNDRPVLQVGRFMLLYRAGKLASDFQQLLLELFFDASQLGFCISALLSALLLNLHHFVQGGDE